MYLLTENSLVGKFIRFGDEVLVVSLSAGCTGGCLYSIPSGFEQKAVCFQSLNINRTITIFRRNNTEITLPDQQAVRKHPSLKSKMDSRLPTSRDKLRGNDMPIIGGVFE